VVRAVSETSWNCGNLFTWQNWGCWEEVWILGYGWLKTLTGRTWGCGE